VKRIAAALVKLEPDIGDDSDLAEHLAALAGSALAPESAYRYRVEKRRKARWAKRRRHVMYRLIVPMLNAQLDAEMREERRVRASGKVK
jgi:hypothetical protein